MGHAQQKRRRIQKLNSTALTEGEIRKFGRDLRILLATNGTLTRILEILANDEITTQIIHQEITDDKLVALSLGRHCAERSLSGRRLRRKVLLRGRSSGKVLVAAESVIAIDVVPPQLMDNLIKMDGPIGESLLAIGIEIFKEAPKFWTATLPGWLQNEEYQHIGREAVAREYRMTIRSQPAMVITEYFPRSAFTDAAGTAVIAVGGGEIGAVVGMNGSGGRSRGDVTTR